MERAYFAVCRTLGRLLRGATYSTVDIVTRDGLRQVRKRRSFHAPVLVLLGDPLTRLLDTGVRVLPQRDWIERERLIYDRVYDASTHVDRADTLVLPCFPGETLATLLDDATLATSARVRAIELAASALRLFHDAGFTHGDAMAENVMVDLDAGVARWFDFETMHDARRPIAWRRADDVRALLATCVLRMGPDEIAETLRLILAAYADEQITPRVAAAFDPVLQRALTFHLGQAALSFRVFEEIGRMLRERVEE